MSIKHLCRHQRACPTSPTSLHPQTPKNLGPCFRRIPVVLLQHYHTRILQYYNTRILYITTPELPARSISKQGIQIRHDQKLDACLGGFSSHTGCLIHNVQPIQVDIPVFAMGLSRMLGSFWRAFNLCLIVGYVVQGLWVCTTSSSSDSLILSHSAPGIGV